jgi:hypothetical protein
MRILLSLGLIVSALSLAGCKSSCCGSCGGGCGGTVYAPQSGSTMTTPYVQPNASTPNAATMPAPAKPGAGAAACGAGGKACG